MIAGHAIVPLVLARADAHSIAPTQLPRRIS
jgi:hypothetical protein